ncbi:MAG: transposase [Negativicutes bacterium]
MYTVSFLDAIHYKVRREGQIVNKSAFMISEIDIDGQNDVQGMWIDESGNAKFWLIILTN